MAPPRRINITNTFRRSYSLAPLESADRRTASPFRLASAMTATGPSPTGRFRRGWWIAALYARAMSSGFATKAGRSRRFGPNPRPDFSGDFYPASREIKQERRST
jgi:hypothetical protein